MEPTDAVIGAKRFFPCVLILNTIFVILVVLLIVFNISTQGKKRLAPITASVGSIATQASGDETVTWTGEAKSVTFTVGDNAQYGTENTKAGQLCFTTITATSTGGGTSTTTYYHSTPDCGITEPSRCVTPKMRG